MEPQPRTPLSEAGRQNLLDTLKQEWRQLHFLTELSEITPYECDALAAFTQLPLGVVLPENEAQVQMVLKTCMRLGIAVVPRGAGTGMAGSAMPTPDGIVLSTAKLNKIVNVNPQARTAQVIMASFDDMGKAGDAVAAVIAAGIIPAGLEMMDGPATRAIDRYLNIGYDTRAEAILLCESDGTAEEVAEEIARMIAVFEQSGAIRIQVSRNEIERLAFWSGRKNAFPAAAQMAPDYYCMDGTVPRRYISTLLRSIAAMEEKYGLQCINVFHAGDGNMHPLILFDSAQGQWPQAEAFGADILEECVRLGGTITGEHGVGIEKINGMCVQFSEAERAAFWGVKFAFDPSGLLNADKAIPTKNRCAEYGRMHIPRGAMKFPDLERF